MGNSELRLIVLSSCKELGEKVNVHLNRMRKTDENYIVSVDEVRFGNGEGKIKINDSIRNKDVFILCDIGNHSQTYNMYGYENHMGPDEHFMDIKRTVSAIRGHAKQISVVMPLLYESRQHKRKGRESLDCAIALQDLAAIGVKSIITFDVHDPNVQNSIPLLPFENFYPTPTILECFIEHENINPDNILVISPDTGAFDRALYFANMLNTNVGVFYKRRDLTKIVNGKNPIIEHQYLGMDVANKDVLVVDDMIASGGSILEVAQELREKNAKNIFLASTFSLFSGGLEIFREAYKKNYFSKIYTTNLSYISEEAKKEPWLCVVDCSLYLSKIIDTLNLQKPITPLKDGKEKISKQIVKKQEQIKKEQETEIQMSLAIGV